MAEENKKAKFVSHQGLENKKDSAVVNKSVDEDVKDDKKNEKTLEEFKLTRARINVNKLPSNFMIYPENSKVSYEPYSYGEIKIFNQSRLTLKESYDFILKGIFTAGFDKENLTLGDFLYLSLMRKIVSYGDSDIMVTYECEGCNKLSRRVVKSSQLDIQDLKVPKLPIIVSLSNGVELHFKPITVKKYLELVDIYGAGDKIDPIAYLTKCCCNLEFKNAYDIINSVSEVDDVEILDRVDEMIYHNIKSVSVKCKNEKETYFQVGDMTYRKLVELCSNKESFEFLIQKHQVNTKQNKDKIISDLGEKIGVLRKELCGFESFLELGGDDVITSPFRGDEHSIKDRIRFGV